MHIENLTKTYGAAFTLGPITCTFGPGETIGILGKNGAGKSTLFEILTGNTDATSGRVLLGTERLTPDRPDLKKRLGYLPQHPVLPKWVTGREILAYAGLLHALPDREEKIRLAEIYWDCKDYATKPMGTLSYGMQKRVGLALATLHDPEILILDEPHSGLDLFHVKALDEAIRRRASHGKTTIISTHVSSFAAAMCDHLYLIESGKLQPLSPWTELDFLGKMAAIDTAFFGKGSPSC